MFRQFEAVWDTHLHGCTGKKKRFKQEVKISSFTCGAVAVEGFKLHAFKTEIYFKT